jgi:hypothetical protein
MANRPVFTPCLESKSLIKEILCEFQWSPGMAPSQKKKNIEALHKAAHSKGKTPVLEVSTKSVMPMGLALSAFNLKVRSPKGAISLESAFQGSKVFEKGGPYTDLYGKDGSAIKKDERLRERGRLLKFRYEGEDWGLEPQTAFYDWLYLRAVDICLEFKALCDFNGFTDIEFNPEKSINCQARSCALYVSLVKRNLLRESLTNKEKFLSILRSYNYSLPPTDGQLDFL